MTAKAFGWKSGLVSVGLLVLCCSLSAWAQPTIKITGPDPFYWECSVPYDDLGAIATDSNGEDITRHLVVDGAHNMDTTILGATYEVKYTVTDSLGLTATDTRRVIITDTVPPFFALEKDLNNRTGEVPITMIPIPSDPDKQPVPPLWLIWLKKEFGPFPELEGEEEEDLEPDPEEFTLTLEDIKDWPEWAQQIAWVWYFYPLGKRQIYRIPNWGGAPMQWLCSDEPWKDPGLEVFDACDITVPLDEVYVVMAEAYLHENYAWEKQIWRGKYTEHNPNYLLPPGGKPYLVGYRFYYYAPDTAGNLGVAVRDVQPTYWSSLTLVEPTYFEVKCGDDSIWPQIEMLEKADRYLDSCRGDVSFLISKTGEVLWDTPGTYYLTYVAGGRVARRTIHVQDAFPNVTLLDKDQNIIPPLKGEDDRERFEKEAAAVLNWCDYLREDPVDDGAIIVEEEEFGLQYWWPLRPDEGFYVTDGCDDGYVISSQTRVHGTGEISKILLGLAARGLSQGHEIYHRLWYEARDPRDNRAYVERPALIVYIPPILSFNIAPDGASDHGAGIWVPSQVYFADNKFQCGHDISLPNGKFDLIGCNLGNLPAYVIDRGGLSTTNPEVGVYTVTYSSYPIDPSRGLSLQVEVEVVDTQAPSVEFGNLGVPEHDGWMIPCFETGTVDSIELIDGCSSANDLTLQKFIWRLLDDRFVNRVPAIERNARGNPVDYSRNNRYKADPGNYVIIYTVEDPDGNTNLPLDDNGLPYVFHSNGGLNIFEEGGKVSNRFKDSVRLVRTEAASLFSSDNPVDEESGFYLLDCVADVEEFLSESLVENCAADSRSRFIWRFQEDGTIKRDRLDQPTHHDATSLKGRFGDYVAVMVSQRGRVNQPPITSQKLPDIINNQGYLKDPDAPYLIRFRIEDTEPPMMTLIGSEIVTLLSGEPYIEQGCEAYDICDGSLDKEIKQSPLPKDIDTSRPGRYTIVYTVADKTGNVGTAYRTVNIIDLTSEDMEITMLGEKEVELECGDPYIDPGVEARYAGESLRVFSRSHNYFGVVGTETGIITLNYYTTTDHGTELLIGERTVIVKDTTPPVIRLNGMPEQTLTLGQPYFEKGATALDVCSGELTVRADGKVNVSKEGVYTITYSAVDDSGLEASTERIVTVERDKAVVEGEAPVIVEGEDEGDPREGEDGSPEETGCGGCTGCNGKKISPAELLGDYLLLGVSLLAFAAFRRRS